MRLQEFMDQLERNTLWVVLVESNGDHEITAKKLQISVDELKARMEYLGMFDDEHKALGG